MQKVQFKLNSGEEDEKSFKSYPPKHLCTHTIGHSKGLTIGALFPVNGWSQPTRPFPRPLCIKIKNLVLGLVHRVPGPVWGRMVGFIGGCIQAGAETVALERGKKIAGVGVVLVTYGALLATCGSPYGYPYGYALVM